MTSYRNFTHNPDCYITTPKDLTIKFGISKTVIKIHSDVLSERLDLFESTNTDPVLDLDTEPRVIIESMQFLHYPAWGSSPYEIIDTSFYRPIVPFAHMYNIKSLLDWCEKGLINIASISYNQDLITLLSFADKYHLNALIKECIYRISTDHYVLTPEEEKTLETCTKKTLIQLEKQRRDEMHFRWSPEIEFRGRFNFMCDLYKIGPGGGHDITEYQLNKDVNKLINEYKAKIEMDHRKRKREDPDVQNKKQRTE
jgi:hypothetical protein